MRIVPAALPQVAERQEPLRVVEKRGILSLQLVAVGLSRNKDACPLTSHLYETMLMIAAIGSEPPFTLARSVAPTSASKKHSRYDCACVTVVQLVSLWSSYQVDDTGSDIDWLSQQVWHR